MMILILIIILIICIGGYLKIKEKSEYQKYLKHKYFARAYHIIKDWREFGYSSKACRNYQRDYRAK